MQDFLSSRFIRSLASIRAAAFGLGMFFCAQVSGQELTFFKGDMSADDLGESSFSWQLDYRQDLHRYFAASVSYLNEGHVTGHHRDGTAWQGWIRLPLFKDRLTLSVGAGPYYFYDTQFDPAGGTANVHDTAVLYSLNATTFLYDRWFLSLRMNRVEPHKIQLHTDTTAVGLGFWFGKEKRPFAHALGDALPDKDYVSENELTLYAGQSVVNTFVSEADLCYAVDYRRGLVPHVDWTGSFIYEGDPKIARRSGVALQLWAVNSFSKTNISVGFGVGPYFYIDKKHPQTFTVRNFRSPAAIAPLVSLTLAVNVTENWMARFTFHRVTSNYNRDSDVFLLGVGYRWGK